MDNGWIKLHRKIIEWEWYNNTNVSRVFIHLLLLANHNKGKWHGVVLEQGQLITGRKSLSKSLGLSERQVRTAIKVLQTTNEVSVQTTNQFSIITIIKWADYQGKPDKTTSETTSKKSDERPQTRSKEDKNNTTINSDKSQVNKIIDMFKVINPMYKDFFSNKTERRAVEDLIKQITYEKLEATILKLPDIINQPYAPKVTKPTELRRDLGKLIAFTKQKRSETIKKTTPNYIL